jgi:cysteine synthase
MRSKTVNPLRAPMCEASTIKDSSTGFVTAGFCETIGRTPLIRLRALSEATGCEILGKAEFLNPGGSVKDRAVPDNISQEKIDGLRAMGAELRAVPEKPYTDPDNYIRVSRRIAEQTAHGFWANQFDNLANRRAHYESTGPELWQQTNREIAGFVASIGTGGTLAGVSLFLKEQNPKIQVVCADPYGAAMWSWVKYGHTDIHDGESFAEGIGQSRVTANLQGVQIDDAYRIADDVAVEMLFHLLHSEGLFLSLSSAINVCGAVKLAREIGPGHVVTTILCDSGSRYVSRLFNPKWLAEKNLTPKARGLEFLQRL